MSAFEFTINIKYCTFVVQVDIMEVAIDKTGSAVERRLVFVDKNRDMFMTQVRVFGTARKTVKLC